MNLLSKPKQLHKPKQLYKLTLCMVMALNLAGTALASPASSQWQPVSSETLVKLPANIIERRIAQDFKASPLALNLAQVESGMQQKSQRIQSIKQQMLQAEGEALVDLKYELVNHKSEYLDMLQESHQLRQAAAIKKLGLYEDVLRDLKNQYNQLDSEQRFQLLEQQNSAKQRMEQVMQQVDQNLLHGGFGEKSQYADEYAANLAQIDKLKAAINRHAANQRPTLNGVEVTSEEYIRQLLLDESMAQSLLDQEGLMLNYMARLVALDAQALEYEIAFGDDSGAQQYGHQTRNAVNDIL